MDEDPIKQSLPTVTSTRELLHQDALERLEWYKITETLSGYAALPATKARFETLTPWIDETRRNEIFAIVDQLLILLDNGAIPTPIAIDFDLFLSGARRNATLSPLALYEVYRTLDFSQQLIKFCRDINRNKYPQIATLLGSLIPNLALILRLQKSVSADGAILSTASPELQSARARLERNRRRVTQILDELIQRKSVRDALQDQLWMFRDGRYVLPVRADRRTEVSGVPRGVSGSGASIFIEPREIGEAQSAIDAAEAEVQLEENRILRELSELTHAQWEQLAEAEVVLIEYDDAHARALLCRTLGGVRPQFHRDSNNTERFAFLQARHPLFIIEGKECVPNDLCLCLSRNGQANSYILVLSGPNAGGKTVALRAIGLCTLMAKAGLHIPAHEAKLFEFEDIFVELGDRQSREDALSTFSGHLLHVKRILENANLQSLVLLDEGFVGTDPAVGTALARATLEYLANRQITVIITTHFSHLKLLAANDERFANACMEFEPRELRPTYRLLNGFPGQSFALELGTRIGFAPEVLDEARRYHGNEAQDIEKTLADLQHYRSEIQSELERQTLIKKRLEGELEQLRAEKRQMAHTRDTLVESYRSRLQKKLNAFEHHLTTRERQFERHKEEELRTLTQSSQPVEEKTSIEPEQVPSFTPISSQKGRRLTSFEDLSKLSIRTPVGKVRNKEADNRPLNQIETPPPKQMTQRSFLDEARTYLGSTRSEFDDTEHELQEDFARLLEIEKRSTQRVQETVTAAARYSANHWRIGMRVRCDKFKETGVVSKPADNKGAVECQFGIIKAKLHFSDLMPANPVERTPPKMQTASKKPSGLKKRTTGTANPIDTTIESTMQLSSNTLDIRGLLVEQGVDQTHTFIDQACCNGIERVIIIHGHGTGRVKNGVREFLAQAPYKLSFRPGQPGEGGDGVTVVKFET